MGLFGFGNSNKTQIQMCALKISTGLGQIEQEFQHSGGEVTPMIRELYQRYTMKQELWRS